MSFGGGREGTETDAAKDPLDGIKRFHEAMNLLCEYVVDQGYAGNRHFDLHAFRTENYDGVKDFGHGCMRTYLILKQKARQFNTDAEIHADDGSTDEFKGAYSWEKATAPKTAALDRVGLGARGLAYERLDQLAVELLLGIR